MSTVRKNRGALSSREEKKPKGGSNVVVIPGVVRPQLAEKNLPVCMICSKPLKFGVPYGRWVDKEGHDTGTGSRDCEEVQKRKRSKL